MKQPENGLAKSRLYEEAEMLERYIGQETKEPGMRKANQLLS